jgi:catechol 2,3-dioxygenase-like lactoylglutathione lyase family enzyme
MHLQPSADDRWRWRLPMIKPLLAYPSFAVKGIPEAKAFYGSVLGLDVEEMQLGRPGFDLPPGLRIRTPAGEVHLYPKPDHKPAAFTVLNVVVRDLEAVVDELSASGVAFEHYDSGTPTDAKGIHRDPAVHPVAWLRDPSGNLISLVEAA